MYHAQKIVFHHFTNTEKRVENTECFSRKKVLKNCFECYVCLLNQNENWGENEEIKIVNIYANQDVTTIHHTIMISCD